jgi:hypothetical protein
VFTVQNKPSSQARPVFLGSGTQLLLLTRHTPRAQKVFKALQSFGVLMSHAPEVVLHVTDSKQFSGSHDFVLYSSKPAVYAVAQTTQ